MKTKLSHYSCTTAISLLILAGCGGGGGSSNNSGPAAPGVSLASAGASVEGLLAYMRVAIGLSSETTEPVDVTGFVAPTSDTTEADPSV